MTILLYVYLIKNILYIPGIYIKLTKNPKESKEVEDVLSLNKSFILIC